MLILHYELLVNALGTSVLLVFLHVTAYTFSISNNVIIIMIIMHYNVYYNTYNTM